MALSTRVYKDINFTFVANPMGGDVSLSEGAKAVKSAIIAIMNTKFYKRCFKC